MAETATKLDVRSRTAAGSRAARRLRRAGRVPGVLYGGQEQAVGFVGVVLEIILGSAAVNGVGSLF